MPTFAAVVGIVLSALAILAAVFQILDIVWDRQDKERIKQRILDFWIQTSDLAILDQVNAALATRYARMRLLRRKFIILFWIFCGVVAGFSSVEILYTKSGPDLQASYSAALKLNFDADFRIRCSYRWSSTHPGEKSAAGNCDPDSASEDDSEVIQYKRRAMDS